MQTSLPPSMWRAYVEACVALADGLRSSARRALREAQDVQQESEKHAPDRPLGFPSPNPHPH
jgi:hypothetical protein